MTEPTLEERITRKKRKLKILSTIIAFPVFFTIVVFVFPPTSDDYAKIQSAVSTCYENALFQQQLLSVGIYFLR